MNGPKKADGPGTPLIIICMVFGLVLAAMVMMSGSGLTLKHDGTEIRLKGGPSPAPIIAPPVLPAPPPPPSATTRWCCA